MTQIRNIILKYRLLLFSVLTFSAAVIIDSNIENLDVQTINKTHFQSTLDKKYARANQSLEEISGKIKETGLKNFIDDYADDYYDLYREDGIVLLVYYQEELEFWNSNILPLHLNDILSDNVQQVVNPGNGWYVMTRLKSSDSLKLFGLILIKHDYTFENEFLVNDYHPDFNLFPEVGIELSPEGDYVIEDPGDNFLFSLIEPFPPVYNKVFSSVACILYTLAFILLLLYIYISFGAFRFRSITSKNIWLAVVIIFLFVLRYLMLEYDYPQIFKSYSLFQPQHYAKSSMFPSLGDFLINAVFILFAAICFSVHFRLPEKRSSKCNTRCIAFTVILNIGLVAYMLYFHYMFSGLIFNSNIQLEVHNFIHLNQFSLIAYLIIAMLLASLVLIADRIIFLSSLLINLKTFIVVLLISLTAGIITYVYPGNSLSIYTGLFFIALLGSITGLRFFRYRYTYSFQVFLVLLTSLFSLATITNKSRAKEKNIKQVIAVNLANERDQVAEFLLEEVEKELETDDIILSMLGSPRHEDYELYNYLKDSYFNGYFRKYELQVASCAHNSDLLLEDVNELVDCYTFFYDMIDEYGVPVSAQSDFFFLDNLNGRISYLGILIFEFDQYPYEITIFISLDSKIMDDQLGYPELLIEGTFPSNQVMLQYSHAKYFNDQLITRSGTYPYPLNLQFEPERGEEFSFLEKEGYEHLVYQIDNENVIVLSKQKITTVDLLTSLSYTFLFFYLIYSVALLICKYPFNLKKWRIDFKNKIKFSMIGVLLLSLIIIGAGTIYYNIRQFENKQYDNISEKIQSVLLDLEYRLGMEDELTPEIEYYITGILIRLSNVFYTDINLYDLEGKLYTSSRPEVFELGLIGEQMNPQAYSKLLLENNVRYVHEESISNLSYLSAYVPLTNDNNEILSYLNLPYFTRQSILKKEIYTLVIAVANIYAILILITILIAVIVSNTITKPLQLIQNKLRELSIGKTNEQIDYDSDDEIGSLIKEYNRMVVELENSAELLARSERESAWREMAKQIAHEIKNPLTPMKLSIQHLQRSWEDKVDNWDEVMKKTTRNLIEQIDHLSSIATAFSNFAKLPKASTAEVDIVSTITGITNLFESTENVDISLSMNGIDSLYVISDKMQLNRIFINLLKNSVQSIPKDREGRISIELIREPDMALVRICDNGTGIPENVRSKLFTPNFTTKSGGMGLGLAIVKNIVEQYGGKIGFTTVHQQGSCFWFKLPCAEKDKQA